MMCKIVLLTLLVSLMNARSLALQTVANTDPNFWWGPDETRGYQDGSIRPFRIVFSDELINDLRFRLSNRRPIPPPLEGSAFRYGFNSNYLQQVLDFWENNYDFKERERYLNQFPQFMTNIQGLDLHFIHVRPRVPQNIMVVPIIMIHGWPGSIKEFYEVIPTLVTPQNGYNFVFEVIVPSIPGFGFSSATNKQGLGAIEISVVFRNLMHRLGHRQFYVQGGDWGAVIGSKMATLFQNEVLGLHCNFLSVLTAKTASKLLLGSIKPSLVVEDRYRDRIYPLTEKLTGALEETGFLHLQATKPDTVGVGLSDSPAGLAAYILEKFSSLTNPNFKNLQDGGLTRKFRLVDLLDNVMIYWASNSITTSFRMYAETINMKQRPNSWDDVVTPVPAWALKTRYEVLYQPDSLIRTKYPNLLGSRTLDDGGHFAAWELPQDFSEDVFRAVAAFQDFRFKSSSTFR